MANRDATHKDVSATNTRIHYLYRDASNYKVYNSCVIHGTLTKSQQKTILDCLDEGEYFIPSLVGLPEQKFETFDPVVDHQWFELDEDGFEETAAPPTISVTADELVASFCRCKNQWMVLYPNNPTQEDPSHTTSHQAETVRTIQTIETERYEKQENHLLKHVGMITGREAFDQLKNHLSEVGLLPDEYFLASSHVDMNQELPEFSTAVCHTDWGGNEGVYIDIALLYSENGQRKQFPFATGKTLDASGDAFLHMSRIAAECSLMLNGRGCQVRVSDRYYDHQASREEDIPALVTRIQTAQSIAASAHDGSDAPGKQLPPER